MKTGVFYSDDLDSPLDYHFEEVKQLRGVASKEDITKIVRSSFRPLRNKQGEIAGYTLILYIGKAVAERAGLDKDTRVKFCVDKNNPRVWYVCRSQDGLGRRLIDTKNVFGTHSHTYRVTMVWNKYVPSPTEQDLKELKTRFWRDGIIIFAE